MKYPKISVFIILLLFVVAGCELEVPNLNEPDTERVLADAEDVVSLVGASFNTFYTATIGGWPLTYQPIVSVNSFEHSAWPANFGMEEYGRIPRQPINNSSAHGFALHFEAMWYRSYRAISAATAGLRQLDAGLITLSPAREALVRAFAKLVQGVSHGLLAIVYDQAIIFDETVDPAQPQQLVPASDVFQAALGYLREAITIAEANAAVSVPPAWTGDGPGEIANLGELAKLARSYRAYFRASMPRTPEEANQVDWTAVITDINDGITRDFAPQADGSESDWFSWNLVYLNFPTGWSQVNYFILGMADQSGKYQTWYNLPHGSKHPLLPGNVPFLIETPDLRFPQGLTEEDQRANPGAYIYVGSTGANWGRPDRGTWRWSYYNWSKFLPYIDGFAGGKTPKLTVRQLQLLKAEALYRTGDLPGAATIINETRVNVGGLNPTDQNGTNTSCVPRLPNGQCGDLWEMLKWEKRLETYHVGLGAWYFDSRRWGDHMVGTFLQLPVPGRELDVLQLPMYTYGGVGGPWAAPVGTYGF